MCFPCTLFCSLQWQICRTQLCVMSVVIYRHAWHDVEQYCCREEMLCHRVCFLISTSYWRYKWASWRVKMHKMCRVKSSLGWLNTARIGWSISVSSKNLGVIQHPKTTILRTGRLCYSVLKPPFVYIWLWINTFVIMRNLMFYGLPSIQAFIETRLKLTDH